MIPFSTYDTAIPTSYPTLPYRSAHHDIWSEHVHHGRVHISNVRMHASGILTVKLHISINAIAAFRCSHLFKKVIGLVLLD
jgi:hypothetical protein